MATELEKALADVENRWAGAPYNYPDAWHYIEARLNRLEALLSVVLVRLGGDSGHTPPPEARGLAANPYNR